MRRELAVKMGPTSWSNPAKEDPYSKLAPAKRAAVFECVGRGRVFLIQQTFEKAPRDARIVVVGVCMEHDTIEPMFGIVKELSCSSCWAIRQRNSPLAEVTGRRPGRRASLITARSVSAA